MNEHAKSIWQAWLDGKSIEYHHDDGLWRDAKPMHAAFLDDDIEWPQDYPKRWRIKPENETRYFRVYLNSEDHGPYIFEGDLEEVPEFEKKPYFGGWLTAWISYEAEVEE